MFRTFQIDVPSDFASKHPDLVGHLSRYQFAYSIAGLILGLVCIIGGLVLLFHGVSALTSNWTLKIPGVEVTMKKSPAGVILFVVGLVIVLATRYEVKVREAHMAKTYTCRDVGVDCDWKVRGSDETEVMRKIRDHARAVHNIHPIPPDLERKVRAAIRDG